MVVQCMIANEITIHQSSNDVEVRNNRPLFAFYNE